MTVTISQTEPFDVSICIVNWNGRKVLADLLESLYKLTDGASIEMIVVDNARQLVGQTIKAVVTSVLQTSAGRMIFANKADERQKRSRSR